MNEIFLKTLEGNLLIDSLLI